MNFDFILLIHNHKISNLNDLQLESIYDKQIKFNVLLLLLLKC